MMTTTQGSTAPAARMLEGKVALITGASRGIGAAAAEAFAAAGATVVLAARDGTALDTLAAKITSAGGSALAVPTDVGDATAVHRLVAQALDRFGRLDAAFNNAGVSHPPIPLADLPIGEYERCMRVSLFGTFVCMQQEIRAMLNNGGGAIVNMASTAGARGVRGLGDYSAAKHGIIGLTRSAALDYAPNNIRVNVVAPGPILTERLATAPEAAREQVNRAVPMGRLGLADEVANAVVWLCSDFAAYVTGTVIPVDGGLLAGPT